jgi:hypothetical protein
MWYHKVFPVELALISCFNIHANGLTHINLIYSYTALTIHESYKLRASVLRTCSHFPLSACRKNVHFLNRPTYSTVCEGTTVGLKYSYIALSLNCNPLTRTGVRTVEETTTEIYLWGLPRNYVIRSFKFFRFSVYGIQFQVLISCW